MHLHPQHGPNFSGSAAHPDSGGKFVLIFMDNISVFQMFNNYILYDVAYSVPYIPVIFPYVLSTCKI